MAVDFSEFDKKVDTKKLAQDAQEAAKNGGTGDFPEVPDGVYIASIENMELGSTKDGRPMFKVMFRLVDAVDDADSNEKAVDFVENWKGKKMPCIFMNRVVFGTKNDGNMIGSVIGFLSKLDSDIDEIVFESYSQFSELILDIAENIDGVLEYEIKYEQDAFNSISIQEVYEI